ncbi:MAG: transporter substrate-binding domain-containing protein [Chlamydiales bacterium]|nr:transporter substrate-binding domain-containing protein [Chlamydiales bacterium]
MKRFLRPLYLLISATVLLLLVLLLWLFLGGRDSSQEDSPDYFRIGRDPNWYPIDTQGKEYELLAFLEELLDEIATQQAIKFDYIDENADAMYPSLARRAVDGIITTILPPNNISGERYVFSDAVYDFGPVLVVNSDSTIQTLDDVKGKILGLLRGSSIYFEVPLDPSIFVITFDNHLQAMERLGTRNVDAVLLPFLPASIFAQSLFQGKLRVASSPITPKPLNVVTVRNERGMALVDNINTGLKKVMESGVYDELLFRWGLPNPSKPPGLESHKEATDRVE